MSPEQPNNPLHGVTLKAMLEDLVARRGWPELAERIPINCFKYYPSLSSSLKFLRKDDNARRRVERLWLADQRRAGRDDRS